jgi:hypothetical protein
MNPDGLEELKYSIEENQDFLVSILIESGPFDGFRFGIENLRLVYENEQGELCLVSDEKEVEDRELRLDFQINLLDVPETYEESSVNVEDFETTVRGLVFNVLMNYSNLYQLGANEHQTSTEATYN